MIQRMKKGRWSFAVNSASPKAHTTTLTTPDFSDVAILSLVCSKFGDLS
jgi:hypothetical protein